MKSTGVVRRVDDLGRVVIPKEIRRNLHFRDGEELEIFVDVDKVILKKYSKLIDIEVLSKKLIEVSSIILDKSVFVCDFNKFICGCGNLKKVFVGKEISNELSKLISNGNIVSCYSPTNFYFIKDSMSKLSYIIYPVVVYGDVIGSCILLSENSDISESDLLLMKMISVFLGKYVED